jgi:hypothetical protein
MRMIKFKQKIDSSDIKQRGAILIFSLLILTVILSITFTLMGIFIPKLRIASDPIKSIIALSVADSGLEWCLYNNRANPVPLLPPPVFSSGATLAVYSPASGFNLTDCNSGISPLDFRAVGIYQGVARSLEISE